MSSKIVTRCARFLSAPEALSSEDRYKSFGANVAWRACIFFQLLPCKIPALVKAIARYQDFTFPHPTNDTGESHPLFGKDVVLLLLIETISF